jgi:hypothetical protein
MWILNRPDGKEGEIIVMEYRSGPDTIQRQQEQKS